MSITYGDDDFLPDGGVPVDLDTRDSVDGLLGAQITRWRDLPHGEAAAAWDELREFVDWLVGRYEITNNVIPPCWFLHGALIEELSALRAAWDASFIVETDGGLGPIGWHERFALARVRFRDAYRGDCDRGGHVESPPVVLKVDDDEWAKRRRTA